jgi:hypothetical protein
MYAIGFGLIVISIVISGRFSPKPSDYEISPNSGDPQSAANPTGESAG